MLEFVCIRSGSYLHLFLNISFCLLLPLICWLSHNWNGSNYLGKKSAVQDLVIIYNLNPFRCITVSINGHV